MSDLDSSIADSRPTGVFTILEPQDQEISEYFVVQERRGTDFEASKIVKGSSGD